MGKKIFSFDAETNGLWGTAFAIAAIVQEFDDNGKLLSHKQFIGRCPIIGVVNDWVEQNVLPTMESIPVNYSSYEDMLKAFSEFYLAEKECAIILVHMGLPVEAKVMIDMHSFGFIGDWEAPYPLTDLSTYPEIWDSVDDFCKANNVSTNPSDYNGGTHNPLFDSQQAINAYMFITSK